MKGNHVIKEDQCQVMCIGGVKYKYNSDKEKNKDKNKNMIR